ncbi:MAG: hypothetical protein OCD02_10390 [Spirochaetaceae bacterium]
MIDSIKSILMDFSGIKNSEIPIYIESQLIKYYPEPKSLVYDYILTKRGNSKKALVSYVLKNSLIKTDIKELYHPHLLFTKLLKRDGFYFIIYGDNLLEVEISLGLFKTVKQSKLRTLDLQKIDTKHIVISDNINYGKCSTFKPKKLLKLEQLYKRCKADLFTKKKIQITKKLYIYYLLLYYY